MADGSISDSRAGVTPKESADEFDRARQAMLRAWRQLVTTSTAPLDLGTEIDGTTRAMHAIHGLEARGPSRS